MLIVRKHYVDMLSIISLIFFILLIIFFIVISIYFFNVSQSRWPSPSTGTIMFWLSLLMIFLLVGISIYIVIHMITNRVLMKVDCVCPGDILEGYDLHSCKSVTLPDSDSKKVTKRPTPTIVPSVVDQRAMPGPSGVGQKAMPGPSVRPKPVVSSQRTPTLQSSIPVNKNESEIPEMLVSSTRSVFP
jgi:hypothetical protein